MKRIFCTMMLMIVVQDACKRRDENHSPSKTITISNWDANAVNVDPAALIATAETRIFKGTLKGTEIAIALIDINHGASVGFYQEVKTQVAKLLKEFQNPLILREGVSCSAPVLSGDSTKQFDGKALNWLYAQAGRRYDRFIERLPQLLWRLQHTGVLKKLACIIDPKTGVGAIGEEIDTAKVMHLVNTSDLNYIDSYCDENPACEKNVVLYPKTTQEINADIVMNELPLGEQILMAFYLQFNREAYTDEDVSRNAYLRWAKRDAIGVEIMRLFKRNTIHAYRNERVLKVLKAKLALGFSHFIVLYGAGHTAALYKYIEARLGLKQTEIRPFKMHCRLVDNAPKGGYSLDCSKKPY